MRTFSLCLLTALALLPGLSFANPCLVGQVSQIHGQVEIERADHAFTPNQGQAICLGDHIKTGAESVADLHLRDGTKITVGKDSEFVIEQFKIYRQRPNLALFSLLKGAFRSITGLITTREHRYEVKTATATLGVRGTDFWGGYGLTANGLDVVMLKGHGVYVKTAQGQVELDQPGLGTTVVGDAAPTAAKTWGQEKLQRALSTITPEQTPPSP